MRGKRRRQNEERILFSSVLITVQINYFCFATCFIVEYISNVIKLSRACHKTPAINQLCVGMTWEFCQLLEVL